MSRNRTAQDETKGFSAAKAGKIDRRTATPRQNAPAATYTVYDENSRTTGTFAVIARLCPKVAPSTLHRRLANGERSLTKLNRPPEDKTGPHRRRRK